jgi:hypothetical protein
VVKRLYYVKTRVLWRVECPIPAGEVRPSVDMVTSPTALVCFEKRETALGSFEDRKAVL